jgi:hypothetical protein
LNHLSDKIKHIFEQFKFEQISKRHSLQNVKAFLLITREDEKKMIDFLWWGGVEKELEAREKKDPPPPE